MIYKTTKYNEIHSVAGVLFEDIKDAEVYAKYFKINSDNILKTKIVAKGAYHDLSENSIQV